MSWLSKFILSAGGHKIPDESIFEPDAIENTIGIHLLSDCGQGHEFVSKEATESIAAELIDQLEWKLGFFQVIVTMEPGLSMEVGGSMNGIDGLSAVYRNRADNQELITEVPPESTKDMIEILISFIRNDDEWKEKYQFS